MNGSLLDLTNVPGLWPLPIVMLAIGLGLSLFYGWFYWRSLTTRWQVEEDDTPLTIRMKPLGGCAGGAVFIGGGLLFVLPVRVVELSLIVAVGWVLLYFPIAAAIRYRASNRRST